MALGSVSGQHMMQERNTQVRYLGTVSRWTEVSLLCVGRAPCMGTTWLR